MPLTRAFKDTVMADLRRDREYRAAYLAEAIESMHSGEYEVGKRMIRNYINGTMGFEALSKAVGSPAKSLMRMLSEDANARADKLFDILSHLQGVDGFKVKIVPERTRARRSGTRQRTT